MPYLNQLQKQHHSIPYRRPRDRPPLEAPGRPRIDLSPDPMPRLDRPRPLAAKGSASGSGQPGSPGSLRPLPANSLASRAGGPGPRRLPPCLKNSGRSVPYPSTRLDCPGDRICGPNRCGGAPGGPLGPDPWRYPGGTPGGPLLPDRSEKPGGAREDLLGSSPAGYRGSYPGGYPGPGPNSVSGGPSTLAYIGGGSVLSRRLEDWPQRGMKASATMSKKPMLEIDLRKKLGYVGDFY